MAETKATTKTHATTGGVAVAVAVILAWIASQSGLDVPAEITAAVATVIGWGGRLIGERLS